MRMPKKHHIQKTEYANLYPPYFTGKIPYFSSLIILFSYPKYFLKIRGLTPATAQNKN